MATDQKMSAFLRKHGPARDRSMCDFDEPCSDCGGEEDYVDPDSGLCDLCAAVSAALDASKIDASGKVH